MASDDNDHSLTSLTSFPRLLLSIVSQYVSGFGATRKVAGSRSDQTEQQPPPLTAVESSNTKNSLTASSQVVVPGSVHRMFSKH